MDSPPHPSTPLAPHITRSSTALRFDLASMAKSLDFKAINANIDPYLTDDVQNTVQIEFIDFLVGLGAQKGRWEGRANNYDIADIVNTMWKSLKSYCEETDERSRYEPFCELANGVLEELAKKNGESIPIRFIRNDPKLISGDYGSEQKPDVVVIRQDSFTDLNEFVPSSNCLLQSNQTYARAPTWYDVLMPFEFKMSKSKMISSESKTTTGTDPEESKGDSLAYVQLMRYAVNQLSYAFNRRHCISALIIDNFLTLAYYDHAGSIKTSALDFVKDQAGFVFFLETLVAMGPEVLGFIRNVKIATNRYDPDNNNPVADNTRTKRVTRGDKAAEEERDKKMEEPLFCFIDEKKDKKRSRRFCWITNINGCMVLIREPLDKRLPYGLVGRGTRVHVVRILQPGGSYQNNLALKASWQLVRREEEWKLLHSARNFLEKKDEQQVQQGDRKLADSLPALHFYEQSDVSLFDAQSFRSLCGLKVGFGLGENRVWRTLVFEILQPLHTIEDESQFQTCFLDIFEAHYWVYMNAKILHRDISIDNLMFRKNGDSVHGVLNDWDLAERTDSDKTDHTGTRTGTRAFMARELLDANPPPRHKLRFEWESFLYYLLWVTFVLGKGEENANRTGLGVRMASWPSKDILDLKEAKGNLLSVAGKREFIRKGGYRFPRTFKKWINPIWGLFVKGILEDPEESENFNDETLGDHLTYEDLKGILVDEGN